MGVLHVFIQMAFFLRDTCCKKTNKLNPLQCCCQGWQSIKVTIYKDSKHHTMSLEGHT